MFDRCTFLGDACTRDLLAAMPGREMLDRAHA